MEFARVSLKGEMALSVVSPPTPRLSRHPLLSFRPFSPSASPLLLLLSRWNRGLSNLCFSSYLSANTHCPARASSNARDSASTENSAGASLLDEELLRRVSSAKDADQVLEMMAEAQGCAGDGAVGTADCNSIIASALDRANAELALSLFSAMRTGFAQGMSEKGSSVARWMWPRPNVKTYALLVRGLAATLRVSDAIKMIAYVSRVGVSSGEEVPFGMIVRCPNCMIAFAVAQPQHGIQVASCSKCRYQYELVSGDIVSIDSEEIRLLLPNAAWIFQHGKRL